MTDAPERIWLKPTQPQHYDDDFYVTLDGSGTAYIRADVAKEMASDAYLDGLADAPQAMVAAEAEACAQIADEWEDRWRESYKDRDGAHCGDILTLGKSDGASHIAAEIRKRT